MKKVITILVSVILIASGMHISIDRHYCGGSLADVKISVTGKLASCGMEQAESSCSNNPAFDQKCCEDQISLYGITSNYYPEYFKIIHPVSERDVTAIKVGTFIPDKSYNTDLISWVLPPGYNLKTGLTQPEICVFRI